MRSGVRQLKPADKKAVRKVMRDARSIFEPDERVAKIQHLRRQIADLRRQIAELKSIKPAQRQRRGKTEG